MREKIIIENADDFVKFLEEYKPKYEVLIENEKYRLYTPDNMPLTFTMCDECLFRVSCGEGDGTVGILPEMIIAHGDNILDMCAEKTLIGGVLVALQC